MTTVAVDCMGGDHGPRVTLAACRLFLEHHLDAKLVLVGLPESLASFSHPRARVVAASEVVGMDDPLEVALRRKKDSSMRVAIQQVKDGVAHAAVSAGNTAALMAISRYILKTVDGIDRPAIAGQIPNATGGATTVRGYRENGLGPKDADGVPTGGEGLIVLNQEIRFPLYRWLNGVGFVDAGNVIDKGEKIGFGELKVGYGFGLRFDTPVGLLRVDLGIPRSPIATTSAATPKKYRFYFGIGHIF